MKDIKWPTFQPSIGTECNLFIILNENDAMQTSGKILKKEGKDCLVQFSLIITGEEIGYWHTDFLRFKLPKTSPHGNYWLTPRNWEPSL